MRGQRGRHGIHHRQGNFRRAAETHLALGRVHIHIHQGGLHLQIQEQGRVQPRRETAVAIAHSAVDNLVLHRAAIQENILHAAVAARRGDGHQITAHSHAGCLCGANPHEGRRRLTPHKIGNPLPQIVRGRHIEHHLAIPHIGEANLRESQRMQAHLVLHMPGLRLITLQELAAHRRIEEEVADTDFRTRGTTGIHQGRLHPALGAHTPALHICRATRGQRQVRDRSNTGQSLTAEPQLADGEQILHLHQLAGGMPLQAQGGIRLAHAAAIIRHLDERDTAAAQLHSHTVSAGINAVLHQFLDHGSRTLHHLTGSHLAGKDITHEVNVLFFGFRHGRAVNLTC